MNKEKVLAALEDCEGLCVDDLYYKQMHCLMGELLFKAGMSNEQISALDHELMVPSILDPWEYEDYEPEIQARSLLVTEYDLDETEIVQMMRVNDSFRYWDEVTDIEIGHPPRQPTARIPIHNKERLELVRLAIEHDTIER